MELNALMKALASCYQQLQKTRQQSESYPNVISCQLTFEPISARHTSSGFEGIYDGVVGIVLQIDLKEDVFAHMSLALYSDQDSWMIVRSLDYENDDGYHVLKDFDDFTIGSHQLVTALDEASSSLVSNVELLKTI